MGEYAEYAGEEIKIGTCEDLLYLRADQLDKIRATEDTHSDVRAHLDAYRFRFPFPDEDNVRPGQFSDPDRGIGVYGVDVPEGVDHGTIQFASGYPWKGLLVSLPCPQGPDALPGLTVHRNGFAGDVRIVQQAWRGGRLVTILRCGSCGATYRLPEFSDAEPLVVALRSLADRELKRYPEPDESRARYWHTIADRITDGYTRTLAGVS